MENKNEIQNEAVYIFHSDISRRTRPNVSNFLGTRKYTMKTSISSKCVTDLEYYLNLRPCGNTLLYIWMEPFPNLWNEKSSNTFEQLFYIVTASWASEEANLSILRTRILMTQKIFLSLKNTLDLNKILRNKAVQIHFALILFNHWPRMRIENILELRENQIKIELCNILRLLSSGEVFSTNLPNFNRFWITNIVYFLLRPSFKINQILKCSRKFFKVKEFLYFYSKVVSNRYILIK